MVIRLIVFAVNYMHIVFFMEGLHLAKNSTVRIFIAVTCLPIDYSDGYQLTVIFRWQVFTDLFCLSIGFSC